MTTKEQERKALAQIRKIVDGLGENSYIGMAFEGCFEIAEENIENDWGCSMKDRWQNAEYAENHLREKVSEKDEEIKNLKSDIERLQSENEKLNECLLTMDDLMLFEQMIKEEIFVAEQKKEVEAEIIVEMADKPNSIDFLNAVKSHRNCQKRIEWLSTTKKGVESVKAAYNK